MPGRPTAAVPAGPVEPVPQLALLPAGQPQHLAGLVGLALDQRERLQHRVVQVRGDLRALGLDDALAALLAEVAHQLEPPRHRDHRDADERGHHREQGELDLAELQVAEQEHGDPARDEHGARDHPPHRRPARQPGAGALGPAAALGLVGLPPHDGRADRGHAERPDDPPDERVARRAARDPDRDAQRREPDRLLALGPRDVPGDVGGAPAARRSTAGRRRARPAPLTPASTTNAARTHSTGTPRCCGDARPPRPPRTARCAGGPAAGSARSSGWSRRPS